MSPDYRPDTRLHTQGTFTSSGNELRWNLLLPQNPDGTPYTIRNGDQLCFRQYNSNAAGGVAVGYPDGTTTFGSLNDQTGTSLNKATAGSTWINRCADISMGGAEQVQPTWLGVVTDTSTGAGSWGIWYGDMSITSTNGTVTPINLGSASLASVQGSGVSGTPSAAWETVAAISDPTNAQVAATHYLFTDHLGSSQMEFAQGGWPVASKQFSPYGTELNSQATLDHYKFTGKERDAESGLDYFGARYYASSMGRCMSPDWAAKEEPVPYAKLDDPQSLNLYAYLGNDPLGSTDPDGHAGAGVIECSGPKCAPRSQREGTPTEKMVAGGLALGIGAVLGVDEIAAAARGAWALGAGLLLTHPEAIQQANEVLSEAGGLGGFKLVPTGDVDQAAVSLAQRLGGQASVRMEGLAGSAATREFDAVSKDFVAQTFSSSNAALKPDNFLSMARLGQIRDTLDAAAQSGSQAYFEFTGGAPAGAVRDLIQRNAERARVTYVIHSN